MMKRLLLGLTLIALLVLAACGSGGEEATDNGASGVETADVNNISVDTGISSVSAEGRIVPVDSADVVFQISGELAELMVTEGDSVSAGDALLRLVDIDQQIDLKQAQAGVVQAEANVESAEASLVSAEAGLVAAQVGVDAAQAQLDSVNAGATTEQIALTEAQVGSAEAGITSANGQFAATVEGATGAQIQAAQAEIAAAEANLVAVRLSRDAVVHGDGATDTEIAQAELQLNAALADVEAARAGLAEAQAGATAGERQAASGGVGAATANRDAAQAQLDLQLAGSRAEEVAIAEISIQQAENGVREAELVIAQAESGLAQARSALIEAQQAVASAESALAKTVIYAPIDGTVARINPKVGEVISSGARVVTIADFSQWQIETTDLTELNIVSVANGMTADIEIDAFPGESLSGTVTDISTTSEVVLGDVTYRVTIDIDNDEGLQLRWGMTSFVVVDVAQ